MGGPYLPDRTQTAVDLVFCNPDLVWKSDFDRPRLGQGAFKQAFQAVFKASGIRLARLSETITRYFSAVANRSNISVYPIWKAYGSDLQIRGAGVVGTTSGKILCWLGVRDKQEQFVVAAMN